MFCQSGQNGIIIVHLDNESKYLPGNLKISLVLSRRRVMLGNNHSWGKVWPNCGSTGFSNIKFK